MHDMTACHRKEELRHPLLHWQQRYMTFPVGSQEAMVFVERAAVSQFTIYISQFPVTITKEQRGSVQKERNLILVHSFRGSVCDQLAESLWAVHCKWCLGESEGTCLTAGKQKGKRRDWDSILPFRVCLQCPKDLILGPTSKRFCISKQVSP